MTAGPFQIRRALVGVVTAAVLLPAPARAEILGSVGVGPLVEPTRWRGPGEVDPGEIELSDTALGAALPLRLTISQDRIRRHAFGVSLGVTPIIGGLRLGQSSSSVRMLVDAMVHISRNHGTWSFQLSAGGAAGRILAKSTNGVLSNDNVDALDGTLLGGVAALSVTRFGAVRDYTFELRGAALFDDHRISVPVMFTASIEWGRDR